MSTRAALPPLEEELRQHLQSAQDVALRGFAEALGSRGDANESEAWVALVFGLQRVFNEVATILA